MNFGDIFRNGHQLGHAAEGFTHVIHIQAGNDHPFACVGQLIAYFHDPFIKKLCFVEANDLAILRQV
ncbi:hypothetical protein D3C87_2048310 [compost metagenome]